MNDDIRRAILEEAALVRHERDCDRAAEAAAMTNDRGTYWRHRAEDCNFTLRHLRNVLSRVRYQEWQRESDWLNVASRRHSREMCGL